MCVSSPKVSAPPPAPPPPTPFLPPELGATEEDIIKKKRKKLGPARLQIPLGGFDGGPPGLGLPTGSTGVRG
jgi:hypothetical protein